MNRGPYAEYIFQSLPRGIRNETLKCESEFLTEVEEMETFSLVIKSERSDSEFYQNANFIIASETEQFILPDIIKTINYDHINIKTEPEEEFVTTVKVEPVELSLSHNIKSEDKFLRSPEEELDLDLSCDDFSSVPNKLEHSDSGGILFYGAISEQQSKTVESKIGSEDLGTKVYMDEQQTTKRYMNVHNRKIKQEAELECSVSKINGREVTGMSAAAAKTPNVRSTPEEIPLDCSICGLRLPKKIKLDTNVPRKPVTCGICKELTRTLNVRSTSKEDPLDCSMCGLRLQKNIKLDTKVPRTPVTCRICEEVTRSKFELSRFFNNRVNFISQSLPIQTAQVKDIEPIIFQNKPRIVNIIRQDQPTVLQNKTLIQIYRKEVLPQTFLISPSNEIQSSEIVSNNVR